MTRLTKRVYVGYGDGAIGMFDATTDKKIDGDFESGAHPESFQLEEKGPRIFCKPGFQQPDEGFG